MLNDVVVVGGWRKQVLPGAVWKLSLEWAGTSRCVHIKEDMLNNRENTLNEAAVLLADGRVDSFGENPK